MNKISLPLLLFFQQLAQKKLLAMKLSACCLLTFMSVQAFSSGFSQETVSFSVKDKNLRSVISLIQEKSSYKVLYNDQVLPADIKITLSVKDMPVAEALEKVLSQTSLFIKVLENKLIVITKSATQPINLIKGKVLDEQGNPIKSASITIVGKSAGTKTNDKGEFELNISNGDQLSVTSIGYEAQQLTIVDESAPMTITMKSVAGSLNDVVVIGYGSVKQKNLTGAVAKINGSDLKLSTSSNFAQSLQGQAPGLQALQPTGQPGANVRVQIRTNPSNASSGVLYVIDGVPVNDAAGDPGTSTRYGNTGVDNSPLNFINPNDIESVQFLKDASSASIYGARAGGGVILITTKQGKSGKPKLDYSFSNAFQSPNKLYSVLNTRDYMTQYNRASAEQWMKQNKVGIYGGIDPSAVTPFVPRFTKTQIDTSTQQPSAIDAITRNGFTQQHNLSLSGSNGKTSYFVSGNYFTQKGVVIGSDYKRYNGRINLTQVISDHIKAGVNIISSNAATSNVVTGGQYQQGGIFTAAFYYPAYLPLQNADGSYPLDPKYPSIPNPLSYTTVDDQTKSNRLLTSGNIEWKIIPGLTAKGNFSYDQSGSKRSSYQPTTFLYGAQAGGIASINQAGTNVSLMEYTLNYSHLFSQKHSLQLLGGYSYQTTSGEGVNAGNQNFITDQFLYNALQSGQAVTPTVGSYKYKNTWASYFGRAIYTFDNKYTLAASVRRDGSSVFAANKKYGVFPSISAGWTISEEAFLKNLPVINYLKLRAGYGTAGNSSIGGNAFAFYNAGGIYNYMFGNTLQTGVQLSQLNNDNLTWETDAELNAGIDFGVMNNRITGSFDYFNKTISNLLAQVPLAPDFLVSSIWQNSGTTKASGYEFGIQSKNIVSSNKGFEWTTGFNSTHFYSYWKERSPDALKALPAYISASGHNAPFNGIYGFISDGINNDGKNISHMPGMLPGGIVIKDIHGYGPDGKLTGPDGIISDADQTVIGSTDPKFNFGFTNTFRYRDFDLSVYIYGAKQKKWNIYKYLYTFQATGTMLAYDWNGLPVIKEAWTHDNTNTKYPSLLGDDTYSGYQTNSSYYLSDASFIRCKDITLGYTLPAGIIRKQKVFSNLRLAFSVQNAFTITKFPEQDPELSPNGFGINDNSVNNFYPLVRSFVIGINASF